VDRHASKAGENTAESDVSPGSLYASGLIAAGGIVGLLGIAVKVMESWHWLPPNFLSWGTKLTFITDNPVVGNIIAIATFALLGFSLFHFARKPLDSGKK